MSGAFRSIHKLKVRAIIPSYTTKYSSVYAWNQILDDRSHPLYGTTVRRYKQRDTSGLWWSVTTPTHGKKRVVRSWVCRRIRQAFREALEARGLDKDGKGVAGTGGAGSNDKARRQKLLNLYGTLRIGAHDQASTAKYEELRQECDVLVSALLSACSRGKETVDSRSVIPQYRPRGGRPSSFSAAGPMSLADAMAPGVPHRKRQRPQQRN
ncbi:uncharacterized protein BDZ99DRAFT_462699 [Mytilinidion resinicola]|uniref:Uncharacterized protein n=1 Tax=Mytilinidion resinicola TaxID=574789 RepID=A0A6A6YQ26_9PEZI|nr:uncharacterized protein BDZ99DRAFT_462699 [Mytilinidion resinicola]KAF2810085.1 hypothetical protein BDZ99DRAFT_462699 [Mytilinidion resinicola]